MKTSDYRREFAAYNSALELARCRHHAGLDAELRAEPIYERYSDLFTLEAINDLRRAYDETSPQFETERAARRSLMGAARIGFMEARVKELTDEYAKCEAAARVQWEGESVPALNLPKIIANEPLSARRRELTARWLDALGACDDLRASCLETLHEAARLLGYVSYRSLYEEITSTDYVRLAAQTDAFLSRTDAAYASALARAMAREVPDAPAGDWQLADYLRFERMPRLDPFFPATKLQATYRLAMSGLGIRVEQQPNIQIDDEPRPLKNPRPACFRVAPPDDVRLIGSPIGGAFDCTTFFHEAGHAQHFAWTSRDLAARYPEFVYAPDLATTEGHAFLFQSLFLDAAWLSERLSVSFERAHEIVSARALLTLHHARRFSAQLRFEIALHESPQVRSEQLAATYAELQEQATSFRRPPPLYLAEMLDGFSVAAYLRAWAFGVALREHLRGRCGRRWWASRKAGDELIDLWNTASRYSVEELAQLLGFGDISFDLLADTFIAAINEE